MARVGEGNIEDYELGQLRGQQIRETQTDAANYVSAESLESDTDNQQYENPSRSDTGNQQHVNLFQVVIKHFSAEDIPGINNNFWNLNDLFPDSPLDIVGDICKMSLLIQKRIWLNWTSHFMLI